MLAFLFKGGCGRHKLFFVGFKGNNIGNRRAASRYGSGFVKHNGLGAAGLLKGNGGFEKHSVFGSHAVSDHNCNRRCKPEGAGTADNKNRNGSSHRKTEITADNKPNGKGQKSNTYNRRNKYSRHLVGQTCHRCLGRRRVADHFDYLRNGCVLSHLFGFAFQKARAADRRGRHLVPFLLFDWKALPGEGRFVHGCVSFNHNSVNRHVTSRANNEYIPNLYVGHRNRHNAAVALDLGGFRGQIHKSLYGVRGLALGMGFEHFSEGYECQNHGRRLKIKSVIYFHLSCGIGHNSHFKEKICAV